MKRYLFRLRLPLAIFILSILASYIVSYTIFYSALSSHASPIRDNYLQIKNNYLEIDFPKFLYAVENETGNVGSGNIYTLTFYTVDSHAIMVFRFYDEKATQSFMSENNLSDAFSIVVSQVKKIYDWTRENNVNASLFFVENGTRKVSSLDTNYSIIIVEDGFKDENGALSNIAGIFISGISQQRIFVIMFYGQEDDWKQSSLQEIFQNILNSTILIV
jgi:hypothetical protein